jgi:hypothetical protein
MRTAVAANDNRFSPEVEALRDAIDALEESAYELQSEDFDEVERLANKLMETISDGKA